MIELDFKVFIPQLEQYSQILDLFKQQNQPQNNSFCQLLQNSNRNFLINKKLEPFIITFETQKFQQLFSNHFSLEETSQIIQSIKISVQQNNKRHSSQLDSIRSQSEVFKQSIFEIILNQQKYQYITYDSQYTYILQLLEIKWEVNLFQTNKIQNLSLVLSLNELLMDSFLRKSFTQIDPLINIQTKDLYQTLYQIELNNTELSDCCEIDYKSIYSFPFVYFQLTLHNTSSKENIAIYVENHDLCLQEIQDFKNEGIDLKENNPEFLKQQIKYYNRESQEISKGEKVQLITSINTYSQQEEISFQNLQAQIMLCQYCYESLQKSFINKSDLSQIQISQYQKDPECNCMKQGYVSYEGKFGVNFAIAIKFQDEQETLINFYDQLEIPKKPLIQVALYSQQKEVLKEDTILLTIFFSNQDVKKHLISVCSSDFEFEHKNQTYNGEIQVDQYFVYDLILQPNY